MGYFPLGLLPIFIYVVVIYLFIHMYHNSTHAHTTCHILGATGLHRAQQCIPAGCGLCGGAATALLRQHGSLGGTSAGGMEPGSDEQVAVHGINIPGPSISTNFFSAFCLFGLDLRSF